MIDDLQKNLIHIAVPGLFTSRGCRSGEEAVHEAVVNYREWAVTKPMR